MIHRSQIKIYAAYRGDDSRITLKERAIIDGATWGLIESFLKKIWIVRNSEASADFEFEIAEEIRASCDSAETVSLLYSISKKWWVRRGFDKNYEEPWWRIMSKLK